MKKYCIVLASGSGSRFGGEKPKQFARIGGKMIVEHTLCACDCELFDQIILVVPPAYVKKISQRVLADGYKTPITVIAGGSSRKESCQLALQIIKDSSAYVVIHNGVQPLVSRECFERGLHELSKCGAVTSVIPSVYTILKVNENGEVTDMPPRQNLYYDMGVECFRLKLLRQLFNNYDDNQSTDIIGMVFRSGLSKVRIVQGDSSNIKITHPEDLVIAKYYLREKKNVKN